MTEREFIKKNVRKQIYEYHKSQGSSIHHSSRPEQMSMCPETSSVEDLSLRTSPKSEQLLRSKERHEKFTNRRQFGDHDNSQAGQRHLQSLKK